MEGCCLPRSRPATRTACPYRTTAHPPTAPLQHARYAPTCPMRHVYYRHMPQLRSGVSLCLWCFRAGPRSRQRTRQHPPLMHMHELAEWGCWVLLWWEFVALSCRGERYVYDLGPRLAAGPFGRFAGASEAPLCGTSHGPRRKKKKKGARNVAAVCPPGAGGKKNGGLTAPYDPPPAIPTQNSTQDLRVF